MKTREQVLTMKEIKELSEVFAVMVEDFNLMKIQRRGSILLKSASVMHKFKLTKEEALFLSAFCKTMSNSINSVEGENNG